MAGGEAFTDLGENIALRRFGTDFYQLLGDRGGPGNNPAVAEEVAGGPGGGQVVHTIVPEEALVLRNQGGIEKSGGDFSQGDRLMAEEVCAGDIIEQHSVAVEDPGRMPGP